MYRYQLYSFLLIQRLQMVHNLSSSSQLLNLLQKNKEHYCKLHVTYRPQPSMSVRQLLVLYIPHSCHLAPIHTLKYLSLKYRIRSLGWSSIFSAGFTSLTLVQFFSTYVLIPPSDKSTQKNHSKAETQD